MYVRTVLTVSVVLTRVRAYGANGDDGFSYCKRHVQLVVAVLRIHSLLYLLVYIHCTL